jgi:hypothetical protein
METIQVRKDDLLTRVRENRDKHRAMFLEAQEGYRKALVDAIEEELSRAREGKRPQWRAMSLPVPEDHTKDYDAVLDMVTMDTRDEIELSQSEFRQYVRDEWRWREEFINTTRTYNG